MAKALSVHASYVLRRLYDGRDAKPEPCLLERRYGFGVNTTVFLVGTKSALRAMDAVENTTFETLRQADLVEIVESRPGRTRYGLSEAGIKTANTAAIPEDYVTPAEARRRKRDAAWDLRQTELQERLRLEMLAGNVRKAEQAVLEAVRRMVHEGGEVGELLAAQTVLETARYASAQANAEGNHSP